MNRRAKSFALFALCVAVVVLLIWQRTQITKLNQHNAELRAQLAGVQRQPVAGPAKPAAPPVANPELLRLRAEVAELRRRKAELARATPNSNPRVEVSSSDGDKLPFEIRIQQNTRGMMRLVLAILSVADDREQAGVAGEFPIVDKDGHLTVELRREWEKILKEDESTATMDFNAVWPDVELLITDAADIRKVDLNTIIARTVPIKMPNGKWTRVYVLRDGSGHRRVHDAPDEVWQAPAP